MLSFKKQFALCLLLLYFFLQSCLPIHQFYQSGRVLNKGQERHLWYGIPTYPTWLCKGSNQSLCTPQDGNSLQKQSQFLLGHEWAVGVLDTHRFFQGLELAYILELPHTLGFKGSLGLPLPSQKWSHSLGAGWDIGLWADNSYWLAYGLDYQLKPAIRLNQGIKWLRGATQFGDLEISPDSNQFLQSKTHPLYQWSGNLDYHIPQWGILPNTLHLGVIWQSQVLPELGQKSVNFADNNWIHQGFWTFNLGLVWQ